MKKILLTAAMAIVCGSVFAQWNISGNNIYYNSGNVGIGTPNPLNALNIIADKTTDAQYQSGLRVDNSASGSTVALLAGVSASANAGYIQTVEPNVSWGTRSLALQPFGGNVGVGTTSPSSRLDVNGGISMQSFGNASSQRGNANSFTNLFLGGALKDNGDGTFNVIGDGGSNYFSAIRMDNSGGNAGAINFYSAASTGGSGYTLTNANLANYLKMTIVGGNVGIGTANPGSYRLAVNGGIHSQSVNVDLTGWSDYVFKKEYQLPTLADVKTYIDQNHRLPEMPSELEVIKDGINLGEMNKLLTKKVEELTLYLIKKDEQLTEQQKQIDELKEQLKSAIKCLSKNE